MRRANKACILIIVAIVNMGTICIDGWAPQTDPESHFELCARVERGDFACGEETQTCHIVACAGEGSCELNEDPEEATATGAVGHWVDYDLMQAWVASHCRRQLLTPVIMFCGPYDRPWQDQYTGYTCACDSTRLIYNCPGNL
jgi:hypothetical protein